MVKFNWLNSGFKVMLGTALSFMFLCFIGNVSAVKYDENIIDSETNEVETGEQEDQNQDRIKSQIREQWCEIVRKYKSLKIFCFRFEITDDVLQDVLRIIDMDYDGYKFMSHNLEAAILNVKRAMGLEFVIGVEDLNQEREELDLMERVLARDDVNIRYYSELLEVVTKEFDAVDAIYDYIYRCPTSEKLYRAITAFELAGGYHARTL